MVLLDNVVDVFNLAHKDRHVSAGVDRIDGRLAGPLLCIAILFGAPFTLMALSKKRFAAAMLRLPSAGSRRSCPACRQRGRGIARRP
jgi:hypothetical protein